MANLSVLFLLVAAFIANDQVSCQSIDLGDPLYLTPYIQSGQFDAGQAAAKVEGLNSVIESYSGFITVNEEYNSNLFFWFFPARYNSPDAPVVLWLNGGPGASSLMGLFAENGPFLIDSHSRLNVREINWAIEFNLIYLDQPAGTGFSFTENWRGYAHNETDVGNDMYEFLLQWFQLFYQFQSNEFYVTGESYAGKYIPAISYTIHQNNPDAEQKLNFKGFAIGDGWIDPINQLNYADFLYYAGMLNQAQREYFYAAQDEIARLINEGKFAAANSLLNQISLRKTKNFREEAVTIGNTFFQFTGIQDVYNYLYTLEPSAVYYFENYYNFPHFRKAVHVGNLSYVMESDVVYGFLFADNTETIAPWLEVLLNSSDYRIMLYNGQVDIICAHSLTTNLISHLDWYGAEDFANADRTVWRVDDVKVGGYVRTAHNFTQVIVRDAGHMVPYDQPEYAFDMIHRFIFNIGF